jgi:hypothetical protein
MWLFTQHGFISITESKEDGNLQLRFRLRQDANNVLAIIKANVKKTAKVLITDRADYRFRIILSHKLAGKAMEILTRAIDYSNFKNHMHKTPDQDAKVHSLHKIWHMLHDMQEQERRIERWDIEDGKAGPAPKRQRIENVLERGRAVTSKTLAEAADCSPIYARQVLRELANEGRLERRQMDGPEIFYLPTKEQPQKRRKSKQEALPLFRNSFDDHGFVRFDDDHNPHA